MFNVTYITKSLNTRETISPATTEYEARKSVAQRLDFDMIVSCEKMPLTMADDTPAGESFFSVSLSYSDGEPFLGRWTGLAKDAADAKAMAQAKYRDVKLDSGRSPLYAIVEMPRYLSSESWGHIFMGSREEITRWVYDRVIEDLVDAQVKNGSAWVRMDLAPKNDLMQSITDNSAIEMAEEWELIESRALPNWFAPTAASDISSATKSRKPKF